MDESILKKIIHKSYNWVKGINDSLHFNFFVEFFYYSTLEIFISCCLGIEILDDREGDNYMGSFILTVIFGCLWIIFIIFFTNLFFCPKGKFCKFTPIERMKSYKDNVGALYENLKYEAGYLYHMVPIIFMIKRIVFTISCFYVK